MKYLTVQEIQYVGPDTCESRLEPLMDALLDLEEADEAIMDPDLAANVSTGRVDIQMTVDAEDPADAIGKALATLRAAIHAIGDATPGWETSTAVMHVAPADAADRLLARTNAAAGGGDIAATMPYINNQSGTNISRKVSVYYA